MEKLIKAGKATLTVAARVLGFSRQAFYKWAAKPVSDRQAQEVELIDKIRQIHSDDPEFGYRLIADELHDQGIEISERRVWRLCSHAQVFSVIARRKLRGKKSGAPVHDDLLQRHFHADALNVAWATDITEHWTKEGKLYLCAIKDLCSRRIVGYATGGRMKSRLVVAALDDAMRKRGNPHGVIVHSDRGSQFRSRIFRAALKSYGARGSMGRVGACGDNAAMESFFALVQKNVLDRGSWNRRRELSAAITH
ncbi:MAG: IS3 family transposase, partial [Actinomycetaceae bacterium]|nr:IS3 family transposase [Actinomycetaceae bacterium]